MSLYYVESNKESSKELFEKRTIYGVDARQSAENYANLVDFNFAEKFLYGRVDRLFTPIVFAPGFLELKQIGAPQKNMFVINFVADAFKALSLEFKRCAASGQISNEDPFLSNLTVHKAYEEPAALYNRYTTTINTAIQAEFRRRNIRVKNFDEFIKELELLLGASVPRFPYTKLAYIKSKICPISCSGLAIEIADLDYSNDQEKINQFVNSRNWEFYVNACRSYGFMVDKFVPWRIVADIGSSAMVRYGVEYGVNTTNKILNLGYVYAHASYFDEFKRFLLNLYNKVKLTNFVETTECNGVTTAAVITPQSYTFERLSTIYSEIHFLKLYFKIRFLEEESHFKDFQKEILMDDCIEIYHIKGSYKCLEVFERILNKTFDYRGSLSYIREYLDTIAAETI